jgi:hypothetical protein
VRPSTANQFDCCQRSVQFAIMNSELPARLSVSSFNQNAPVILQRTNRAVDHVLPDDMGRGLQEWLLNSFSLITSSSN